MRCRTSFLLAILLTSAASAGSYCGATRDDAALKTAALQQYLMVAALTCHQVAAYNDFVLSHRSELQESDRNLHRYFMRRDAARGDADYNAFKTKLANASSMRSIHDPRFCQIADDAFYSASNPRKPLWVVAEERPMPLADQGLGCTQTASGAPVSSHKEDMERQAWLGGY